MNAMRILCFVFAVSALCLSGNVALAPASDSASVTATSADSEPAPTLASARGAAVDLPIEHEMTDNYGDPDAFVKYIIRKPPVLA